MTETPLTNRQSYWLNHYQRCKEQMLSFEEYCRQNNLSPGAFGHARGKLAKIGALGLEKSDKPKKTLALSLSNQPHSSMEAEPKIALGQPMPRCRIALGGF